MCLIVVKPRGFPMPKDKLLKRWFVSHPDGFGLAFQSNDHVTILKGGLAQRQMFGIIRTMHKHLAAIGKKPTDIDLILHFRQATDGSVSPKNCHPFPVTSDKPSLAALTLDCPLALAHNGVIYDYSSYSYSQWSPPAGDITDTQLFIEQYLAYFGDSLFNPAVQSLIAHHTSSKFALLTPTGYQLIGTFEQAKGYLFSNSGYKAPVTIVTSAPSASTSTSSWADNMVKVVKDGITYYYSKKHYPELDTQPTCDLCDSVEEQLYYMPNDDDSQVCFNCYANVMGFKPTPQDRVPDADLLASSIDYSAMEYP